MKCNMLLSIKVKTLIKILYQFKEYVHRGYWQNFWR